MPIGNPICTAINCNDASINRFSFLLTDMELQGVLHSDRKGMSDNNFAYVCAQEGMYS